MKKTGVWELQDFYCHRLVMSEVLLDSRGQTVDVSAFQPNRFAEGNPIKAEFEYVDD